MSDPLPDEAFAINKSIKMQNLTSIGGKNEIEVYAYEITDYGSDRINVEFINRYGDSGFIMVDAYFHPEDLERLGVLFQYLGQQAIALRDQKG